MGGYRSESDDGALASSSGRPSALGVCPHPGMTNQQAQEQVERRYWMSVSAVSRMYLQNNAEVLEFLQTSENRPSSGNLRKKCHQEESHPVINTAKL